MNIIGIDPGKTGGIAIRYAGRDVPTPYPLKKMTEQDVFSLLDSCESGVAFLEKVHSGPKQGSSAAFSFGYSFGILRMAAIASRHQVHLVTPQKWQSVLGLPKIGGGFGKNDTEKKNRNKAAAQELYPNLIITHAIADCLLLCEFGRRFIRGTE